FLPFDFREGRIVQLNVLGAVQKPLLQNKSVSPSFPFFVVQAMWWHRRSFKPANKTTLKLVVSRIKLLKNCKEAHVKQLRSQVAQLLHSAHNHTARVRVEYVFMEEKTMAAYDLIEIYCEFIAARMPMIESQKNCPIDLKEAISSVIFASQRCLDISELVDVRKHIEAKYGKQFVSAALELRPNSGLVEKLSTKAPDGPTKIIILTAIAEEYNVKWQPSLEENDLLAGPNTSEKVATSVEPPQLHVPHVGDEKVPPKLRASSFQLGKIQDISKISYEKSASLKFSGSGSEEMDFGNLYPENVRSFQKGRENWKMEFKDATSAAQAAAESAERASVAARAAAELSDREKLTRQCSSGWQCSCSGELPQEYAFLAAKHLSAGYVNSTFRRSSCEIHNEQTNVREQYSLVGSPNEHYMNNTENVVKCYQKVEGEANTRDSSHYDSENGLSKQNSALPASELSRRTLAPSKTSTCLSLKGDPLSNASKPSSEPTSEEIITLSVRVQPSSSLTKAMIPNSEEAAKSSNSDEDIPSKEKASHVHPKLPDCDALAAQFLSRKKGR
ncbi:IST1-like protein, partial [Mucuna pruriens]